MVVLALVLALAAGAAVNMESWAESPFRPMRSEVVTGQRMAPAAPSPSGSNFDRERLAALFGSDAQPVYGTRDPTTGRVTLDTITPAPLPSSGVARTAPVDDYELLETESLDEDEPIDRKDTRVPETNEINPFELLPPQFHDILNIPLHDYGNGTTFNPYDKYKVPKAPAKFPPLVSTGYANTKVQGSSNRAPPPASQRPLPAYKVKNPGLVKRPAYDYDDATAYGQKSSTTRRPPVQKAKPTQAPVYDDYYDDYEPTTKKYRRPVTTTTTTTTTTTPKPTTTKSRSKAPTKYQEPVRSRPEYQEPPRYRPEYQQPPRYKPETEEPQSYWADEYDTEPEYQQPPRYKQPSRPIPQEAPVDAPQAYKPPFESTAIRVSPKPFLAGNGDVYGTPGEDLHLAGQVDDAPDIIYDYDDAKGDSVMFMFDRPHSSQDNRQPSPVKPPVYQPTPAPAKPAPTPAPVRAQSETLGPASFRPSLPMDRSPDAFTPKPESAPQANQRPPQFQQPPQGRPFVIPSPLVEPRPPFRQAPPSRFPLEADPPRFQLEPQANPPRFQLEAPANPPRFSSEQPILPHRQPQPQPALPHENEPPVVLPLFRPNAKPTEHYQFINQQPLGPSAGDHLRQQHHNHAQHPQVKQQQPNPQGGPPQGPQGLQGPQGPQGPQVQPQGRPGQRPPPGTKPHPPPLQSALRSPLAQVSQAVASFFGRRSGTQVGKRSTEGDMAVAEVGEEEPEEPTKADRIGMVPHLPLNEAILEGSPRVAASDLNPAAGTNPFANLFSTGSQALPKSRQPEWSPITAGSNQRPGQPLLAPGPVQSVPVDSSADASPPAFYMYTTKELEEGRPPYLVVGPQLGPPPKVQGAELVHTIPVQELTPESQRRNDLTSDGVRPLSPNALPFNRPTPVPALASAHATFPEPVVPVRKPQSGSPTRLSNRPVGLVPPPPPVQPTLLPQQQPNSRPSSGFLFPDPFVVGGGGLPQEVPVGISPSVQGALPPRVPMNPQKDVATPIGDHVLFQNEPVWSQLGQPTASVESVPIDFGGAEAPLAAPVLSQEAPAKPVRKPGAVLDSGLPKPFVIPPPPSPPKAPLAEAPQAPALVAAPEPVTPPTTTTPPPTTTTTMRTTTVDFSYQSFNQLGPVKYSTIQQEDGKQIAVVHPAYIVTYRAKPGVPDLYDLDAPFQPSQQAPVLIENHDENHDDDDGDDDDDENDQVQQEESDEQEDDEDEEEQPAWQTNANERSFDESQPTAESAAPMYHVEPRVPSMSLTSSVQKPYFESGFIPYVPGQP